MRRILSLPIFAVALVMANPAAAQEPKSDSEMIEKLADPEFQDGMADMMSGVMGAMMELPVGQIVAAVENALPEGIDKDRKPSNIAPDATLRDLAARDNPNFERDMDDKMRKGTAMMGIMASEFAAMLPQLKEMGEKMKRRMEKLD